MHYVTKKPTSAKKQAHKHRKKLKHAKTHAKNKKKSKAFLKTGEGTRSSYQESSRIVSMPFANVNKSQEDIEEEEEEILRKYGSKESEEENEAAPGKLAMSYLCTLCARNIMFGIQLVCRIKILVILMFFRSVGRRVHRVVCMEQVSCTMWWWGTREV